MRRFLTLLSLLLLAVSCREPDTLEQFVPGEGPFEYTVNMSDSLSTYDFAFYTRLDGRHRDIECEREMPLTVVWQAPSNQLFAETVFLPLAGTDKTFYSRQVRVPYRSGVVPAEAGVWTLRVSVPVRIPGLRGLGLITTKKPWDTEN